jgi:hypothetical protein
LPDYKPIETKKLPDYKPTTKKLPDYKMPDRNTKMKSKVTNSIADMYK